MKQSHAIIAIVWALSASAPAAPEPGAAAARVFPPPQAVHAGQGRMILDQATTLSHSAGCEAVGRVFAERLRRGTGWPVPVVAASQGTIHLEMVADPHQSPEAYGLEIRPAGIAIRAGAPAGIARGAESLLQMMPEAVYGEGRIAAVTLPALTLRDSPRFGWRGAMLDVSRRFQDKDTVLKLLDGLAACKLNIFHWHLTDDQGWRLPIAGYPKLTEGGPAYSRGDIREVVERAAALGITVLPELDMPGHSSASCRAYPEIATLNDQGRPTATMNGGAEASYVFVEAVMKDVAAQFPGSPYVHIGADEVGTGGWAKDAQCRELMVREKLNGPHELYHYFINRVVGIARGHGLRCIAWDEAFDPRNDPELIIMSWRNMKPGVAAATAGRQVIATPNPAVYINHANTRSKNNPIAYSAHPTYLNHCYFLYADTPAIPPAGRARVMGGEVCLWGERLTGADNMFIHMFPRVAALAENLWLPREKLDWNAFIGRLALMNRRFTALGIPLFWEPETLAVNIGAWQPGELAAAKGVIDLPLGPLAHAGEQEFFVTQTTAGGQFRVTRMELLRNGVVVDTDRHPHDSSVFVNVDCMYILQNPDTTGSYILRVHASPLHGDCEALIQHHPALAPDGYSKQCAPGSGANRSKQSPPES